MSPKATKTTKAATKKPVAKKAPAKKAPAKKAPAKKPATKKPAATKKPVAKKAPAKKKVVLLSGGNPQIAKGYGNAPVQAYIKAMPGWKSAFGKWLDALIGKAVPGVKKAVKWNSPMYGVEENHWFLGVHVFAKYVKVAFFKGAQLRPLPPGTSKQKSVRYLDVREDSALDEKQVVSWVKQAAALPGEKM